LRHALALVLFASVPVAVAGALYADRLLGLFGPDAEVVRLGTPYLRWVLAACPGFFAGMVLYSVFQATGDTRTPMYVMLGTNLANMVLDPVLIFGWLGLPRLGVAGAAIATVSVQSVGLAVMALVLVRRGLLRPGALQRRVFATLLGIGGPAGLQAVTRPLTAMLMFGIVTGFGTAATAAFGIGLRALEVMYIYLSGLGSAGEALVGQSLGRRDPELAARFIRRIVVIGSVLQAAVLPLLFAFAPQVVGLFNGDPEVVRTGAGYLRWCTPWLVVLGLSTGWAGAQRGAGATTMPMAAALVSNWLVKIPTALLLARAAGLGLPGVWLGIGASVAVESAVLAVGYYRGGWKRKELVWS
jgi:putative MATE family efflux protein